MPISFPNNPSNGQIFQSANGYTYVYRTETDSWIGSFPLTETETPIAGPQGINGYTGSQGVVGYTGSQGGLISLVGSNIAASTEFLNIAPVSRIMLTINNLRISDNHGLLVQLGTSSGYINEENRYMSSSSWINGTTGAVSSLFSSTGFYISLNSNNVFLNATINLVKVTNNLWTCTHNGSATSGAQTTQALANYFNIVGGGSMDMGPNILGRLRVIVRSAAEYCSPVPGTIQAGSCRILYE